MATFNAHSPVPIPADVWQEETQVNPEEARRMVGFARGRMVIASSLTEEEGNKIIDLSMFDLHEDER